MFRRNWKKIIALILCSSCIFTLTGCKNGTRTDQNIIDTLLTITSSEYIDAIKQSRIVSPYAVINSFNKDFVESTKIYNNQALAVEITGEDIKNGKLYIEDSKQEGVTIDGNYCLFVEGFEDETIEGDQTSLVISIDDVDSYLIPYGLPTTQEVEMVDDDGNTYYEEQTVDALVSKFFLVGKINKVVGDKVNGDEKINIIMENARLIPATTYQELTIEQGETTSTSDVLDANSGENITQTTYAYHFGSYDYNEDGFCDDLTVQIDEFKPTSTLDKLLFSNILSKIKTPIDSYIQILYNGDNSTAGIFSINYPLTLNTLTAGQCASFDGSYSNYVKVKLNGLSRADLNYAQNKKTIDSNFPELEESEFYLEPKDVFFNINEKKATDVKVNLLNGEVESATNPKHLWLNNTNVAMSGLVTGDNFIITSYPFECMYVPQLYFYTDGYMKEGIADEYIFYNLDRYLLTGDIVNNDSVGEYNFISKKNIYVSSEKVQLINTEVTSDVNSLVETGVGYYNDIDEETGETVVKTTNIFYTGNQRFTFASLSRDDKDKELYWLEILSENGNRGYVPLKMSGPWTKSDTIFAFTDNVSEKNYYLFDSKDGEFEGIFTEADDLDNNSDSFYVDNTNTSKNNNYSFYISNGVSTEDKANETSYSIDNGNANTLNNQDNSSSSSNQDYEGPSNKEGFEYK